MIRPPVVGLVLVAAAVSGCAPSARPSGPAAPAAALSEYRLLATAESDDQVALIRFVPCAIPSPAGSGTNRDEPCGARVERTYPVGLWSAETEGPHGVVAAPDGRSFYVTLAHGRPFGYLQRVDLGTGAVLSTVELGMFPATVDLGHGSLVYAVNFNFEDPDMAPSSVSVVDPGSGNGLLEIARTTTCRMPHGSRLSPDRARHYSACMMDDLLVEIDARTFAVTRMFRVAAGSEGPVDPADARRAARDHAGHGDGRTQPACSPTWAEPSADGRSVFVACNRSREIVEVDAETWSLRRRWKTPPAPYNLAVSPDGRLLLATQKGPGTITAWRLADAVLLAEIAGTRGVASGVVVSPDSRYGFVTLEAVGGEPGAVDVVDLRLLRRVASVDIGKQAGGIALLP